MVEIKLLEVRHGPYSRKPLFYDEKLRDGGILINTDTYLPSLHRLYNVKGLEEMKIEIKNSGGSNGLTFVVEKCRIEYADIDALVNADFEEEQGDTNVAPGATSKVSINNISPEIAAIRIKFKRQTAGLDTTMEGILHVN